MTETIKDEPVCDCQESANYDPAVSGRGEIMTSLTSFHRVAAIVIGEPRQLDGDLGWCALLTLAGSNGGAQAEITIFGKTREAVVPFRYKGLEDASQTVVTRKRAAEGGGEL